MANKTVLEAQIDSNVGEVADGMDKLSKETKETTSGIKKLGVGFGTLAKVSGIVFLLNKAFEAFQQVLGQNQRVVDFFNIAMEASSLAFNDLFRFIDNNIGTITGHLKALFTDPLGELYKLGQGIKKFFVEQLIDVGTVLTSLGRILTTNPITNPKLFSLAVAGFTASLGKVKKDLTATFDEITSSVTEYTKGIIENATATVTLRKESDLAAVKVQGLIEDYDRQAEKLRQVRDDETLTFEERIAANNKLGEVLKEQEREMLKLIDIQIAAAQADLDKNNSIENQIRLQELLNERKGVEAQITGFQSEQLINNIALNKEQKQVALDNANAQLEAYSALAGALSSLAGENKALAVAQAIIDTYAAANGALAAGKGTPLAMVQAAAIILQGLNNVRKIMAVDVGTGGGGSVPSPGTETPAPEFVGSGTFNLSNVQPRTEPIQAYVVTDDLTSSQDKLALIRRRATI